jgi:[NiFe] hydrogenase assembly HybE family chaperone
MRDSSPTPLELERAFQRVHSERMQDVPILNPALEVSAVRFRIWKGYNLGVMLTPWFMNLVLLPGEHEPWPELRIGDARSYGFPSGTYDFLLGELDDIGRYLACSLFSPVFEFEDQVTAVAVAQAVMVELFKKRDRPEAANDTAHSVVHSSDQIDEPSLTRNLSRRDFLCGKTSE